MSTTKKLIEEIGNMSVKNLADLVKELEETFGVSAASAVAAAPAAGGAAAAAPAEEKSEFKVTLKEAGSEMIKVIKALRSITTLSLGDSKRAVEDVPFEVAPAATKEEAQKMKKALEDAGAKVELS